MEKLNGFKNESDLVKYLDGKRVKELNPMFRSFIDCLFENPKLNSRIICYKNSLRQKSDIFIRIGSIVKGISIKTGSRNSIHVEPISEFIHFLIENKVSRECVIEYLKYQYADGTTNGKGKNRISSEEYKKMNQEGIDKINISINNPDLLNNAIDKFILKGNNSNTYISAIIHGDVSDFVWITKEDIRKIILSKTNIYSTAVHFGTLTCQPKIDV